MKIRSYMVLVIIIILSGCTRETVSQVTYPESVAFDDSDGQREIRNKYVVGDDFAQRLNDFTYDFSATVFQTVPEEDMYNTNHIFSPLSLYYGLAMAYTGAEQGTKEALAELLNMGDMEMSSFFSENKSLYNQLYRDNEITRLKIANSLWVQKGVVLNKDYRQNAADNLYASVNTVDFDTKAASEAIKRWLSEETGGLLDDQMEVNLVADQLMAMYNTVYFRDQWGSRFNESQTEEGIFYKHNGSEVTCDFMYQQKLGTHWRGEDFDLVSLGTKGSSSMVLVLPDEGVDLYTWLSKRENIGCLNTYNNGTLSEVYGNIYLTIPKFDYSGNMKLKESLYQMGLEEVFTLKADFGGIADEKMLYLGDIHQKTRISIDEKGIEAASYTEMLYDGSAEPKEDLEMVLNRPFIIAVRSQNQLLFVGVVNDPSLN